MPELDCTIDLSSIDKQCGKCRACSSQSVSDYHFVEDLRNSDAFVAALKEYISKSTPFTCTGPEQVKYPDIRVLDMAGNLVCRVEAKLLKDKPFMTVNKALSGHDLFPKETIVVDLPKLTSYFEIRHKDGSDIPTFVAWHLIRPCPDIGTITIFQNLNVLKEIYNQHGEERTFIRQPKDGDYTNGRQLGIITKFHYSITECRPIEEIIQDICSLRK